MLTRLERCQIKADTIIFDVQQNFGFGFLKRHGYFGSFCVFADVGKGFLYDAVYAKLSVC